MHMSMHIVVVFVEPFPTVLRFADLNFVKETLS